MKTILQNQNGGFRVCKCQASYNELSYHLIDKQRMGGSLSPTLSLIRGMHYYCSHADSYGSLLTFASPSSHTPTKSITFPRLYFFFPSLLGFFFLFNPILVYNISTLYWFFPFPPLPSYDNLERVLIWLRYLGIDDQNSKASNKKTAATLFPRTWFYSSYNLKGVEIKT